MTHFEWKQQGELGIIEFNTPDARVNVLSSGALREFDQFLDDVRQRTNITALLITSGKPTTFIAGADIKEIESLTDPDLAGEMADYGKQVFQKLAELPMLTMAVINGACLGGGLELALACDYRVAGFADSIKIGLPEIKLGILPGFGGCLRLPQQIGIANALSLILPGKMVDSRKALKLGLIDRRFYDPILLAEAKKFARNLLAQAERARPRKRNWVEWLMEGNPLGRKLLFRQARKNVLKSTHGHYPAPLTALDVIQRTVGQSPQAAAQLESAALGKLAVSEISKNLVHVFHLDETYKKKQWTTATPLVSPVEKAAVVGAGVMGGGIAQLLSKQGVVSRIKDLNNEALALALKTARKVYDYQIKTRRMTQSQVDAHLSLISPTITYAGFGNVDVVIEAVVERLEIKQQVFRELDQVAPSRACLFTNTSSLPVTQIANSSQRPEQVCGFHFFNPVHRMPLLEIIKTEMTSEATVATAVALARQLGKMPIVVGDQEGFLVNRILLPYMNEAAYLLQEGVDPERLDHVAKEFGMPMGPLELADEVGIDIGYHVAKILEAAYGTRMQVAPILQKVYDLGFLGKKSGTGFYIHNGQQKQVNKKILRLRNTSADSLADDVIRDRLIDTMVNEASRCLEEGVVDSAATIDVGMIYGTGFPPFRGGLMKYADGIGLKTILDSLDEFQDRFDQQRFAPSQLIQSMAEAGASFYEAGLEQAKQSATPHTSKLSVGETS